MDEEHRAEYERWLSGCSEHCTCCGDCWESPCAGTMQGGFCDGVPCRCDDEPYWEDDPEERPAHD